MGARKNMEKNSKEKQKNSCCPNDQIRPRLYASKFDAYHANQREREGEKGMPTLHMQFSLFIDWGKRKSKKVSFAMMVR